MICFFCKSDITSDHICQELADHSTKGSTPTVIGEMRLRFQTLSANKRKGKRGRKK